MVKEAEDFASEDEAQRKRIEALNSLSSFVYGLKTQLADKEGLGGKISDDDKKTLLATIKETTEWIDENGQNASVEDLEEKLSGASRPQGFPHSIITDSVLQRSKASLPPSPQNYTRVVISQEEMTMDPTMMSCECCEQLQRLFCGDPLL
jgi:hypothetical protein